MLKTQIEVAREGVVTLQMKAVAGDEGVSAEYVRQMVAEGKIVIGGRGGEELVV